MPVTQVQPGITAIVICHNAADQLDRCLRTLRWADELLVVNIQSTDNSLEIASRWADRILSHAKDESLYKARVDAIKQAHHDWVLIASPHDQMDVSFPRDLRKMLGFEQSTALLKIPRTFTVKDKPLPTVPVGMEHQTWLAVLCKSRCDINERPLMYAVAKDGFATQDWPDTLVHPVRFACATGSKHWYTAVREQALARHLAAKRLTMGELTVKPIRTLAGVIGHFWQPRRCVRDINTLLLELAVAGMVAVHQLRRTPRNDSKQIQSADTANRKAA